MISKPLLFLTGAAILLGCALEIRAQEPPRGPRDEFRPRGEPDGGPPDDFGPGRGPRRPNEKMRLGHLWRDIARLENAPRALSKTQAAQFVALVLPWSKKPQMSENDAQILHQKIEAVLTSAQNSELEKGPFRRPPHDENRPPRDFGDGGPPPREDSPHGERGRPPHRDFDGPPPRGGPPEMRGLSRAQRQIVRDWMETTHPFYAPTGYAAWKKLPSDLAQDSARRYRENRATLEALSRKSHR